LTTLFLLPFDEDAIFADDEIDDDDDDNNEVDNV